MPKFYSVQRKVSLQQSVQMAYIAIKTSKIIKLHELTLLKRGNLGKITKFGGGGGAGGGGGGGGGRGGCVGKRANNQETFLHPYAKCSNFQLFLLFFPFELYLQC